MNRRKLSFILAAIMLVNLVLGMAVPVYADVDERIAMMEARENIPDITEGIGEENEETEIPDAIQEVLDEMGKDVAADSDVVTDENSGETATGLDVESKAETGTDTIESKRATSSVVISEDGEYYLTMTAEAEDGVIVMLEADKDVFPDGVTLSASVADDETAEAAAEQIAEEASASEGESVKLVTYDIKVLLNGEEIEPDTSKGKVNVSFIIPNAPAEADTATIYHHTEEGLETVLEDTELSTDSELSEEAMESIEAVDGTINETLDSAGIPQYLLEDEILTNDVNDEVNDIFEEYFEDDCEEDCDCDYSESDADSSSVESPFTYANPEDVTTIVMDDGVIIQKLEKQPTLEDEYETKDEVVVLTATVESLSPYTINYKCKTKELTISFPLDVTVSLQRLVDQCGIGLTVKSGTTPTVTYENSKDNGKLSVTLVDGDWKLKFSELPLSKVTLQYDSTTSYNQKFEIYGYTSSSSPATSGKYKAYIRGVGDQATEGLRTDQLLEVYTEGYDPSDTLTYNYSFTFPKDTTAAGYIHFFNSCDMTVSKEAANIALNTTTTKSGSYKYFASLGNPPVNTDMKMTITVKVTSKKGAPTLTCSYSNLAYPNLRSDVNNASFIMFEGESTSNIRNLYGLSGVTHISCTHAYTKDLKVEGVAGKLSNDIISVTKSADKTKTSDSKTITYNDYSLTALKEGKTYFTLTVGKTNSCDHHPRQVVDDARTAVWVIKKPVFIDLGGGDVQVVTLTHDVSYTIDGVTIKYDGTNTLIFEDVVNKVCTLTATDGDQRLRKEFDFTLHSCTWEYDDDTDATMKARCTDTTCPNHTWQVLTVTASDAPFDGSKHGATVTNTSGDASKLGAKTVTLNYYKSGSSTPLSDVPSDAGQYQAKASIDNGYTAFANYSITKKTNTVVINAPADWQYKDSPNSPSVKSADNTTGIKYYYRTKGSAEAWSETVPTEIGEYEVYALVPENSEYAEGKSNTVYFKITAKTVKVEGITAKDKAYDGNTDAELVLTGVTLNGTPLSESSFPGLGVTVTGGTFNTAAAGTGKTVTINGLALTGTNKSKYTLASDSQKTTTASITEKAVKVDGIRAEDKKWDGGKSATLIYDDVTFDGSKIAGLSVTATGEFEDANVGTNKKVNLKGITLTGSAAGNYKLADSGNQTVTHATISYNLIDPDDIEVASKSYNKTKQQATIPSLTGCTVKTNEGGTDAGLYDVVFALSDGYAWTDGSRDDLTKKFEIMPKVVTVQNVGAQDKVYDGTTKATLSFAADSIVGNLDGDGLKARGTGTFNNKNVGTGKPVAISALALYGDAAGNYKLSETGNQTETTASITAKTIKVKSGVYAEDKVYDATLTATVSTAGIVFEGLCPGDSLGADAKGEFASKNVTAEKQTVTLTKFELTGADKDNYNVDLGSIGTLKAKITPAEVKVSGIVASSKVYDGTTLATISNQGTLNGKLPGDTLTHTITDKHFDNKNAGTGKTVYLTVALEGADKGNYVLSADSQKTALADIYKKKISHGIVTGVEAEDKDYDGLVTATLSTASDARLYDPETGEYIPVLDAEGEFLTPEAGVDKDVKITGLVLGDGEDNYDVDYDTLDRLQADIRKALVTKPSGQYTYYNAKEQTSTVSETALYGVTQAKGTNVGPYTVILTLTDPTNYKWPDSDTETSTVIFEIRKALTVEIEGPVIEDWNYGASPSEPYATPTNAYPEEIEYWYEGTLRDGTPYGPTQEVPEDAGSYFVIASISETPNHPAAKKSTPFRILPLPVDEPVAASKSYTDYKQIADVADTGEYQITKNDGGINADIYPVEAKLKDKNNYRWSKFGFMPVIEMTTVPFEITKATIVEIEGPAIEDWYYGASPSEPYATPTNAYPEEIEYWYEGTLRDGTPYGPTQTTPSDAGSYKVIASISETPNHPAAKKSTPFRILPLPVEEPTVASKSYTGYHQVGDISGTDKYSVFSNLGGINAQVYDVILELWYPNNYYWNNKGMSTVIPQTTVPFEITKATIVEIEGPVIEDWNYGASPSEPYATPTNAPREDMEFWYEGTLRDGTPYGPTQTTPSDAGTYKVIASISETPNHPAAKKSTPFTIWPKVVEEPTAASKSYTGYTQTADVTDTDEYWITKNDGGINADIYPVDAKLKDANNYRWSRFGFTPVIAETTVPFEITRATKVEIEGPAIEDWYYGASPSEPYATPTNAYKEEIEYWYEGALRDGTPYAPTQTTPSDAGKYYVIASISETPNHPAAKKSTPFRILPIPVEEPTAASKSYTGYTQTADVADTGEYQITKNDGGINADIYPVDAKLKDANNYRWSKFGFMPVIEMTTVPFEITKATIVEIEGPAIEDWYYGASPSEPYATPTNAYPEEIEYWYEGTLRDGTPYGPTQTTPSDAGSYKVIASISETPNHPAAKKSTPFRILPLPVEEPTVASKSYTGYKQIGDISNTDKYFVFRNLGGIHAQVYDVILELLYPNNYYWLSKGMSDVIPQATVPFEILKATDNEIPQNELKEGFKDWIYWASPSVVASPSVSPEYGTPSSLKVQPKYGTPSYTFYKEQPDGTWKILASSSEEPYKTATPTEVGHYKVVIYVPGTDDWEEITREWDFWIYPALIQLPSAPDKVYNGSRQIAWLYESTPSEEYSILQNDGGIEVGKYPVVLEAGPNYLWDLGTATASVATISFAIIPDPINPKTPEEKAKGEEYKSGNSTLKVHSNIEEGAPLSYIENLNLELAYNLLSPEEKAEYDAGSGIHIEVVLNVKEKDEESVGATDSQIVHDMADRNGAQFGVYLDLTLDKIVTNSTGGILDGTTRIRDTAPQQLQIVVRVPEELRKERRTYYIARVHEYPEPIGVVGDFISTTIMPDTWIDISFLTDKFSTYAILYKDAATPGGGGSTTTEYKWWKPTDSGWVKKPGTEDWYVIQNNNLVKGWFHDNEDAYWYYLDPSSGIMKSGWQQIGGKHYYFTPIDQVPQGTWFYNQNGDGKWHYYGDRSFHTYGSMYCNEQTPDGYWVDETGARIDADGKWWSPEEADAGWVRKNGTTDWYYIKNDTLKKGWHDDQEDGHRYYLDPLTGIMFKNWNRIGNYMYYFTTDADAPQQTWFKDKSADGKWHYYGNGAVLHPLGSMYKNETTPDGRTVDANGHRID